LNSKFQCFIQTHTHTHTHSLLYVHILSPFISAFKAKFQAQITVPEHYTALFNTMELKVTHINGTKVYLFEETPGTRALHIHLPLDSIQDERSMLQNVTKINY
jgi:hypothetical protein